MKTKTRKSRALAWVLTLSMVLNLFPDIARAGEEAAFTGSGTSEDPYLVTSAEQLAQVTVAGHWKLGNDIELTGNWVPIGTEANPFTGNFDGDKHLIRGLRTSSEDYSGLFGYISGATIQNLGLEDVEISSNGHAGGIAGQLPVLKGSSAIGDPPSYLDDNWGGDGISES